MDPTNKKFPKSTFHPTTTRPDPTKHFSSLNTNQKVHASLKQTHVDTHLQAKAMSLSAIADSSSTLLKPNRHFVYTMPNVKNQNKVSTQEAIKEKLKKSSKDKDKKESHERRGIKKMPSNGAKDKVEKESHEGSTIVKARELKESHEEVDMKRPSVPLGRRRSLCGAFVELADFFSTNGAKVVSVDMPPFMQVHAVDCARKACDSLEKFSSKTLAFTLKKEFDGVYGPAWHCIAGTGFGSFVTHSVGGFLYFSMDQKLYILLFKTTVQRAD